MKKNNLVSIVVPIYNSQNYLKDVVDRIINQTYRDLEIILVNDGSTDNSSFICESYKKKDSRVIVINKDNGGLSSARNAGTRVANGDYIAYIDSDDLISKYYIECLVKNLETADADLSVCGVKVFKDGTNPSFEDVYLNNNMILGNKEALIDWLYMSNIWTGVMGKLLKIDIAKKVSFSEGKFYEDIIPVYNWIKNSRRIIYTENILFRYRISSMQQSAKPFSIREMDCIDFYDELVELIKEDFKTYFGELTKPLAHRVLSGNMIIYMKLPLDTFSEERDRIWDNIQKYRMTVLFDSNARLKARIISLLTLIGKKKFLLVVKRLDQFRKKFNSKYIIE